MVWLIPTSSVSSLRVLPLLLQPFQHLEYTVSSLSGATCLKCLLFMPLPYTSVIKLSSISFLRGNFLTLHFKAASLFIIFTKDGYQSLKGWQMGLGENSPFTQSPFPQASHRKHSNRCCSELNRTWQKWPAGIIVLSKSHDLRQVTSNVGHEFS